MEGRTIVRPDLGFSLIVVRIAIILQWRAGQSSGQTRTTQPTESRMGILQWRAGQSSGQTACFDTRFDQRWRPSMEGRTIVRPDHTRQRCVGCCDRRLQWRAGQSSGQTPLLKSGLRRTKPLQWRAGQSSGQTISSVIVSGRGARLQWRAGQSSGQTGCIRVRRPQDHSPSMEGRTIVRPDPADEPSKLKRLMSLQWRAGQSSGQTIKIESIGTFGQFPSMEGRTIVRPDAATAYMMAGATPSFNGGPDNRPARRG